MNKDGYVAGVSIGVHYDKRAFVTDNSVVDDDQKY